MRVAALDAYPRNAAATVATRAEWVVGLLLGCGVGFGLIGWALGRDWER